MNQAEIDKAMRCRHFTGIHRKTCDAGVRYLDVRSDDGFPDNFPCWLSGKHISCSKREWKSVAELETEKAEFDRIVAEAIERIAQGQCIECGEKIAYKRQVIQSTYAEPCGHRQGVGNARAWNKEHGANPPESVHSDPEWGRYDEWGDIDRALGIDN